MPSYNPSHRDHCMCIRCKTVFENTNDNVFLHIGTGSFTPAEFNELPEGSNLVVSQTFKELEQPGIGRKPKGIWLSGGSWGIDSFHDWPEAHQQPPRRVRVIVARDLDILKVSTYAEVLVFCNVYGVDELDTKSRNRAVKKDDLTNSLSRVDRGTVAGQVADQCTHYGIPFASLESVIGEACRRHEHFSDKEIALSLLKICPDLKIDEKFLSPSSIEMSFYNSHVELILCHTYRLREFYNFHMLDVLSEEKDSFVRNPAIINWQKIKDDGWHGIFFNFRKISHIVPPGTPYDWREFEWHEGFDSESAVVWDEEAFRGMTVETVTI